MLIYIFFWNGSVRLVSLYLFSLLKNTIWYETVFHLRDLGCYKEIRHLGYSENFQRILLLLFSRTCCNLFIVGNI